MDNNKNESSTVAQIDGHDEDRKTTSGVKLRAFEDDYIVVSGCYILPKNADEGAFP